MKQHSYLRRLLCERPVCWDERWRINEEQYQLSVKAWGESSHAGAACTVWAGPAEMLTLPFWAFCTNSELQAARAWPGQIKHSEEQLLDGWGQLIDLCSFQPPDQRLYVVPRSSSCSEASTGVPGVALHSVGWLSASPLLRRCASPLCIKYFKKWKM